MEILLSRNKEIIKEYIEEKSKIGFIPTASELDKDRWYIEKDIEDLNKMKFNIVYIDVSKESKEEIVKKFNDIDAIFVAYQPLRRNRTHLRNYDLLVELSRKYNKSQNQIILNWIIKEKNIKVLIKSTNCNRIDENIESLNFKMEQSDYKRLNDFKNEEFENIKIDWNNTGDGISIDQLPNQFE